MNRRLRDSAHVFRTELGAFLRVCEAVDTPRSLACYMLAKNGEWLQYLNLSFPDTLSESFADDYLVTEMMGKNPRLPIKIDRKAAALAKFADSEQKCKETNLRLKSLDRKSVV